MCVSGTANANWWNWQRTHLCHTEKILLNTDFLLFLSILVQVNTQFVSCSYTQQYKPSENSKLRNGMLQNKLLNMIPLDFLHQLVPRNYLPEADENSRWKSSSYFCQSCLILCNDQYHGWHLLTATIKFFM